jgi:uncharacterized protein (DUF952 family)
MMVQTRIGRKKMMILHCMKASDWELAKGQTHFGQASVTREGFVHCSPVNYFWRVAPLFQNETEDLVLLCLDTEKITAPIKWEDGDNAGRFYPHVYGLVYTDAVTMVLPFLRDEQGRFVKNPELFAYPDE